MSCQSDVVIKCKLGDVRGMLSDPQLLKVSTMVKRPPTAKEILDTPKTLRHRRKAVEQFVVDDTMTLNDYFCLMSVLESLAIK